MLRITKVWIITITVLYLLLSFNIIAFSQPSFNNIEDKNQINYYLLNCDTKSELQIGNEIYCIRIPFILISKDNKHHVEYTKCFDTKYYEYNKGIFKYFFTKCLITPKLYGDVITKNICGHFFDKLGYKKWEKIYFISILSNSRSKLEAINPELIKIGTSSDIKLKKKDLVNFSFTLYKVVDYTAQTLQSLQLSNPCYDEQHYAYYTFNNEECNYLLKQFQGNSIDSTTTTTTSSTTSTTTWTTTTSTTSTTSTTIPHRRQTIPITDIDIDNIIPNFGYINFNKTTSRLPANTSYLAFIENKSDERRIIISPLKKKDAYSSYQFYQPENVQEISYFLNSGMEIINIYAKNQIMPPPRYNGKIIQKNNYENAITSLSKYKNELEETLSPLMKGTFENIEVNNKLSEAISMIGNIPAIYLDDYKNLGNIYARVKVDGNYIIIENKDYYIQKTGHIWVLKDFKNRYPPAPFVLPKNNYGPESNHFKTVWGEEIPYTKIPVYHSDNYLFEIKATKLTDKQLLYQPTDIAAIKQAIKFKLKKWFIFDGDRKNDMLTIFKNSTILKKLVRKYKPKFNYTFGNVMRSIDTNKHSDVSGFIEQDEKSANITARLLELNPDRDNVWEVHIFVNSSSRYGAIKKKPSPAMLQKIQKIQKKIVSAGILRLCLWEFKSTSGDEQQTYFESLVEKVSTGNERNYKIKHEFIKTTDDFQKPFDLMSQKFRQQ